MQRVFIALCGLLFVFNLAVAGQSSPYAPNVSVYVSQRIFPPQTPASISLTTYNLKNAVLSIYATDIATLVPNAEVIDAGDNSADSVVRRLAAMKLDAPCRRWSVAVKDFYRDTNRRQQVELPQLHSGVYILQAQGEEPPRAPGSPSPSRL